MASDAVTDPSVLEAHMAKVQQLLEEFKEHEEVVRWLQCYNKPDPEFAEVFSDVDIETCHRRFGEKVGTAVFNAAHPDKPCYKKWIYLRMFKFMSPTTLRQALKGKDLNAEAWMDLAQHANAFVLNSNDFATFATTFSKFKLQKPKPKKELEMYKDTRNLFEPLALQLGLGLVPPTEAEVVDSRYADARIVPMVVVDSDYDDVVTNTYLDIEIKTPWKSTNAATPWATLAADGTDGGTPSVGLKNIIARAEHFYSYSTTQQQTYFAVITDHHQFVFVSIDRTGNLKLTFPVTDPQSYLSIIWYLCSLRNQASGFRNAASSIPLLPSPSALPLQIATQFMPIGKANHPLVTLETEAGEKWVLNLTSLLGQGAHGLVFSCKQSNFATSKNELDLLCLKLAPESSSLSTEQLELEAYHLGFTRACPYAPKVIAKGKLYLGGNPCQALLTDVVGVPLPNLSKSQLQSILPNLWHEMCFVLGQIHARGLVHCDVKPNHFVVNHSGLWLIDFGSSYHTYTRVFRQHNLYTTPMFSSPRVFANNGTWPSAQDDIQSAAYSFVSLLSSDGMLPDGHQSNPSRLVELVRPQHRSLVNIVLVEAHLVPEDVKAEQV